MMTLPLLVLLCAAVCAMAAENSAEPQQRFRLVNNFESGLRRPDSIYFRKRGSGGFSGFGRLAEKRRVRELFGKRSAPTYDASEDYLSDSADDQYQSIYDLMQMHRDRRGRARELFG